MIPATISLLVGTNVFSVALADNPTAEAFAERLPLAIEMTDLHHNEKYADLDEALPFKPEKVGRIETGDVMLFGDDCLVVFYKSFDTPWTYTRIGKIENTAGLPAAVGSGAVKVSFKEKNEQ